MGCGGRGLGFFAKSMPTVVIFMVDAPVRFKWLSTRYHFGTSMPLRVGASIPLREPFLIMCIVSMLAMRMLAAKGIEPAHRPHDSLAVPVVLLDDVVEVLRLAQLDVCARVGAHALDGRRVGITLVSAWRWLTRASTSPAIPPSHRVLRASGQIVHTGRASA